MQEFDLFDEENTLLKEAYEGTNIRVRDVNKHSNTCLIFFSGNGLYYPDDAETFLQKIKIDDSYEWWNLTKDAKKLAKVGKMIYVRDIYKQWYVNGINCKVNTLDKLADHLVMLTEGMEISTIGNSAGGFIATLMGIKLNAKNIYNFSGQYDLSYCIDSNYYLNKHKNEWGHYYHLIELIEKSSCNLFYFYPAKAEQDIKQASLVKDMQQVYPFAFDCADHGTTMASVCYQYVFAMDSDRLMKICKHYSGRLINRKEFMIRVSGIWNTILGYSQYKVRKIKNRK